MATKLVKKGPQKAKKTISEALEPVKSAMEDQLRASLDLLERSVGGRKRLIDALAVSNHPSARKFVLELTKGTNGDLSLYEVCEKIRISPDELTKIYTEGSLVRSTVQVFMKLADGLPEVMDVAIDSAKIKGPQGFQDRKLLFEVSGVQKQDSGIQINMNQLNLGNEGSFEKVVGRTGVSITKNPFDVEAEEVSSG